MVTNKLGLVMLVDDNETDNFISEKIIEMAGFADKVIAMDSGSSALEYIQANNYSEDSIPDLIFLDINMPFVDGFVFLFEFERFSDLVKNKCRIVILSSSDNKKDIDRIVDNKFVISYVVKPLSIDAIKKLEKQIF
ncbi:MAG: response regulator [Cytophagales bacterium]|nr:response regulator [Cytophagales bacterium]